MLSILCGLGPCRAGDPRCMFAEDPSGARQPCPGWVSSYIDADHKCGWHMWERHIQEMKRQLHLLGSGERVKWVMPFPSGELVGELSRG